VTRRPGTPVPATLATTTGERYGSYARSVISGASV